MKNYYSQFSKTAPFLLITTLLFFLSSIGMGQIVRDRIVEGVLRDGGDVIPGVNVIIKGTGIGTVSDMDGRYSIQVALGDILVYSYIGFTTTEVEVTGSNSRPIYERQYTLPAESKQKYLPNIIYKENESGKHIAYLGDESNSFLINYRNYNKTINGVPKDGKSSGYEFLPSSINTIRYKSPSWLKRKYKMESSKGQFIINERLRSSSSNAISLLFNSSFSTNHPFRLPELQANFAQGRPQNGGLTWFGPETSEIFSYGPEIDNLEFDGSAYPWDNNGMLVQKGLGNGKNVNSYNPYAVLYKPGTRSNNYIKLTIPIGRKFSTAADIGYDNNSSFIPNSISKKILSGIRFTNNGYGRLDFDANLRYSKSWNQLMPEGGTYATLFSSMMRTPITFDNQNGIKAKNALTDPSSYQFDNGLLRNHAVGMADNPYWLLNSMKNDLNQSQLLAGFKLDYQFIDFFSLDVGANYHRKENKRQFGLGAGSSGSVDGRFTSRDQLDNFINSNFELSYQNRWYIFYLEPSIKYQVSLLSSTLDRYDDTDLSNYGSLASTIYYNQSRIIHEPALNLRVGFGPHYYSTIFKLNLLINGYLSTTHEENELFLPTLGASIDVSDLLNSFEVSRINLRGEISKTIHEAELIYPSLSFNTLKYETSDYASFYERNELLYEKQKEVNPEDITKYETGIDLRFFDHLISLSYNYYQNHIDNLQYPVLRENEFSIENIGKVVTIGNEFELGVATYSYNDFHFRTNLTFHNFRPTVKELYTTESLISIAGFSDVFGVASKDDPLGMIYGSRFARDEDGNIVIGEDGFPLVDSEPGPIGNPNPDWIAGLETKLTFERLSLSFLLETSQGGQIWNGTSNALNYFGVSAESGKYRETKGYIFEGVTTNGEANETAVDFTDPGLPLEENRWVRYGFSGVAEEGIEDASWFKLSELRITYDISDLFSKTFNFPLESEISLFAKNLFIISNYSGADPESTLFSYPIASGLDLFNTPPVRTFGLSLTIKN